MSLVSVPWSPRTKERWGRHLALVLLWSIPGLIASTQVYFIQLRYEPIPFVSALLWQMPVWLFWVPASPLVLWLGRRFPIDRDRRLTSLLAHVVATLALHHVPDHEEKRELYRAIRAALEPGGLLVVGDLLIHPEGPERRQMLRDWYAHMASHGITEEEADAHFAQWAEEDFYVALDEELALLRAAGFPRPDCFWRDGGISVYGGFES